MNDTFKDFLDLLKHLIRFPSVVGAEYPFFRVLQRELEEAGAAVSMYQGILVAQGKRPGQHYLSAHADRHGLVCTGPNEFQYAAYVANRRGDLLDNAISEKMFNTVVNRFDGRQVLAYEFLSGMYLGAGTIHHAFMCPHRNNMVFEVGGLNHVSAGTPVGFQDRLSIENGLMRGQLDNVISVAALVHLFQLGYQGTAFFTAQEEAGRSWRFLLEWLNRFEHTTRNLMVLDTSPFNDRDAAGQQDVVLRRRDANGTFDPQAVQHLETVCREKGVAYSFKDAFVEVQNQQREAEGLSPLSYGSTELGRIVTASQGRIQGATLQIPTTEYHTVNETASVASCKAFLEVLKRLAL